MRRSEIFPFAVRIHNHATGSFARRFRMKEGAALPRAIVEFVLRDPEALRESAGTDAPDRAAPQFPAPHGFADSPSEGIVVSEEHITAFGWAGTYDMEEMFHLALRVNDILSGFCLGAGLRLARVELAFGRIWEEEYARVVLADEITPDSCRFWDLRENRPLSALSESASEEAAGGTKARPTGAGESGSAAQARRLYQEVARRFGVLTEPEDSAQQAQSAPPAAGSESHRAGAAKNASVHFIHRSGTLRALRAASPFKRAPQAVPAPAHPPGGHPPGAPKQDGDTPPTDGKR